MTLKMNCELMYNFLSIMCSISEEINKLKKDNNFIDKILEEGAEKADKITSKKVKEMKKIVGF